MLSIVVVVLSLQLALSASLILAGLVAHLCRMRVERISIGFGRPLLVVRAGATRWQLGSIPLGGFVQIAGREAVGEIVPHDDPRAFHNRPLLLRILPSLVIPVGFSVVASLLMTASFVVWGVPSPSQRALVGGIRPGSPAERAGLELGDEVTAIDDKPVSSSEVAPAIQAAQGRPVEVTVRRGESTVRRQIVPEVVGGVARIGIQIDPGEVYARTSVIDASWRGLQFPLEYDRFILHSFGEIFAGKQRAEFAGPVGIVKVVGKQEGKGRETLALAAIMCCYLGLFLYLPVPPNPGGRVVMILCGWRSRRRKLTREARDLGQLVRPRGRFPRALLGVLIPLGLVMIAVAVQVPWSPLDPWAPAGLLAIGCLGLGLGRGWPRLWIATVNVLLMDLVVIVVRASASEDKISELVACAVVATMLVVLSRSSVRRWFHQECPACSSLGGRPVWSLRRSFGCVRCGSCWRD